MVQAGSYLKTTEQSWESYSDLHKYARSQRNESKTAPEYILNFTLTATAAAHEIEQDGGLTIADAGKTALTLVLACDTNDNAYDGQSVIMHYFTNAGVAKTVTVFYDDTATTTEVACMADFYCWDLVNYTPATVIVSSVAVQAGDNVYIGLTGLVAGAKKRYATIAAAATYPVVTTLFGVGNVFGAEETDTAGDVGKVITLNYVNPWGLLRTASFTLAATTTNIIRLTDTTTGYPVLDFYRKREIKTTGVVGKYVGIGIDADKVVGTVALDTWYGVIEEGNWQSTHSAFMALNSTHFDALGKLEFQKSDATTVITIVVTSTNFGDAASHTDTYYFKAESCVIDIHKRIEPLSEVTFTFADDNAAHPVVNSRITMVEV